MNRMGASCLVLTLVAPAATIPAVAGNAPTFVQETDSAPSDSILAPTAACVLEPGPLLASTYVSVMGPDAFTDLYWRLPVQSCQACGSNPVEIKTVSFRIRWQGPCDAHAQVRIVGVTGPSGCKTPDTTHVLCGPTLHPISGVTSAGVIHTLTIPAGCCVATDAFVQVRLLGLGDCYPAGFLSPGINYTTLPCVTCDEYFTTVGIPPATDWCLVGPNSLWIQVADTCCTVVGVAPEPGLGRTTAISILEAPSRRVRMRITLGARGPVELGIYDIAGRKVRDLMRAEWDSGDHFVDWDGTSDAGSRLPAGVYKVKFAAGSSRAVATAVLLD